MAASGLLGAFGDLRPALLRYLAVRGAADDEAEDILQDVALKLASEATGPVDQPRAYLYRMTNNHFLLHRRTNGRRARREEDWAASQLGDPPEVDPTPSVEAGLIAREQVAILQRILDGLPERTRTIFRRFRIDGEPQRVIAAELGISVSAIEKHLTTAYGKIASAKLKLDGGGTDRRYLKGERGQDGQ